MPDIRKDLENLGLSEAGMACFLGLMQKYHSGPSKIPAWESARSPDEASLLRYEALKMPDTVVSKAQWSRLVVCKLNGGLGTSMGCQGPKSGIPVRGDNTFLDLIVDHLAHVNREFQARVPLLLMNSFYTHDETGEIIKKYEDCLDIRSFCQNRFPRINEETGRPLGKEFGTDAWYPPGHGDFYFCAQEQGILDRLVSDGRDILFVSNADNLGAATDLRILNLMVEREIPFLMEMTPKTAADVKGGTLYQQEGKLKLLEIAQVPEEHLDEFCGQEKFKVFNTNNIWINLARLKNMTAPLDLAVIVNRKQIRGLPVVQLETAIGSALDCFPGAVGLTVSRERFFPVKTTSDLILVQSDLFVHDGGLLRRNPARNIPGFPRIRLENPFNQLEEYKARIPVIPGLLDLESLDLKGDVRFEGKATLKGKVRLVAENSPLIVSDGEVLNDKVILQ